MRVIRYIIERFDKYSESKWIEKRFSVSKNEKHDVYIEKHYWEAKDKIHFCYQEWSKAIDN